MLYAGDLLAFMGESVAFAKLYIALFSFALLLLGFKLLLARNKVNLGLQLSQRPVQVARIQLFHSQVGQLLVFRLGLIRTLEGNAQLDASVAEGTGHVSSLVDEGLSR